MEPKPDTASNRPHPLADVSGLPAAWQAAFRRQWIESAEQVIGMAATPEGREGLQALLTCGGRELDDLLAELQTVVGPEAAQRLRQATPGGARGLRLTAEQKKRWGVE